MLVAAGLAKLQNSARNQGRTDPVTSAVQGLITPAATSVQRGAQGVADFWAGIAGARAMAEENRSLQSLRLSASLYNERVADLIEQIQELRRAAGITPIVGRQQVPAAVIGYFPHENRLTISIGADKGAKPGMPIVAPAGLVGVVQTVSAHTSQINLLTSPQVSLGAMVATSPKQAGILRGGSAERLTLDLVDVALPLAPGDMVVTSGFSDKIPRGIPVGRVLQVESQPEFGTRRAQVVPSIEIARLQQVFLLK